MKIPFTEQFLWDVYRFIQGLEELHRSQMQPSIRERLIYPELAELRRQYRKKRSEKQFNKLIYHLKQKGLIKIQHEGVMLTPKGVEKATRVRWKIVRSERRTDGKMVMVIYDFPEDKRRLRDLFRSILVSLGYQEFQLSVWICKKKVESETEAAIQEYKLWDYVRLFVIKEIN